MNRIEPNLLLAVSTGLALALLIFSAALFGEPGQTMKYVIVAAVSCVGFVVLNGWWSRRAGQPQSPMIQRGVVGAAVWAGLLPGLVMAAAAVPFVFPGHDYGLLVLIGGIWFGLTVQSVIRAGRRVES